MKELGGYFELELSKGKNYYSDVISLNSARNCLRYLIRALHIKYILIPAYTCPVVWEALEDENCQYSFYDINENFLPESDLGNNAYILYNNYFGVCDKQVSEMCARYKNVIIDNSQAFYSQKKEVNCFCSARKFFGVPDGGFLYTSKTLKEVLEQDVSVERFVHLLERIEYGASAGYGHFQVAELALEHAPIKQMSKITSSIMKSIDYERIAKKRKENFNYLHENLSKYNFLELKLDDKEIPMVYPFLNIEEGHLLKKKLLSRKVFIATYWLGQKDKYFGRILEKSLLALPIDQRYDKSDMDYILEVLND